MSLNYPGTPSPQQLSGLYPVDFIIEGILKAGLNWFKTDPTAGNAVYGQLASPWLAGKYGPAKITEIVNYVKKYEIKIVQHWSTIPTNSPCFSIQLLDGSEELSRTGLGDHAGQIDSFDGDMNVIGRRHVIYSPITDNVHIGIHTEVSPDLTKYLYYLLIYILNIYKPTLEERGMQLGTYRASDISRLNEYLPENMFSRFVNFTVFSIPTFDAGAVPIITDIEGVHIPGGSEAIAEEGVIPEFDEETGVTVSGGS